MFVYGGDRLDEGEGSRVGAGASERLALYAQHEGDGILPNAENGEDEEDVGVQLAKPRPRRPADPAARLRVTGLPSSPAQRRGGCSSPRGVCGDKREGKQVGQPGYGECA